MLTFDPRLQDESHELLPTDRGSPLKSATVEILKSDDEPKKGRLHRWRTGWTFMLFLSSVACVLVLAFNTGFLLWAVARDRVENGQGLLFEGDCDRVGRLNTGLHLLINLFSTIILGASNYGMQCLCAPTRKDVDRVHQRGGWLNIGVPSLKNIRHVSKRRSALWFCLLVSSVPLHLLYNSTVFYTISAYGYDAFVGYDSPAGKPLDSLDYGADYEVTFTRLYETAEKGGLKNLTEIECYNAFAETYHTTYGSVILISDDVDSAYDYGHIESEPVWRPLQDWTPHSWMCQYDPVCAAEAEQGNWTLPWDPYRINSCLAERVPQRCRLQYSLPLTIAVIVANLAKAIILGYMSFSRADPPMLTTGDAVASFLHRPDPFSVGRCLLSAKEVRGSGQSTDDNQYRPVAYHGDRARWYSAVPKRKWVPIIIFWAVAIGICIGLIIYGQQNDGSEIWAAKFGKTASMNASTIIKGDWWPKSLLANTIIANVPQLIFSLLYFVSNSILTNMTLAAEWSRYALLRRGLRVSWNAQAAQRKSYFLSLPYRYAVPLMASSATLHWLISQSIFLVGVDAYDAEWERAEALDVMTCGYTPIAIVSSLSVGAVIVLAMLALGLRRLDSAMVVAGSCSLAIAAACHPGHDPNLQHDESRRAGPLQEKEDMEYSPVMWGSVPVDGEVGHCTFASGEVEEPEVGRFYQ
ncbi:hypothetical protein BJY01DRAFT_250343 [Aspergillus pseudoustus]|uniref:DUF6536 domain-containing protein n=1 Tax=Aspergillus pseudoustus TaxID=1810923 RepID=A0ABR4JL84_9EURO